jgi:nucleoside-diphosphate-sugar epimerase
MNIVVTGCEGKIGQNVIKGLGKKHRITGVDIVQNTGSACYQFIQSALGKKAILIEAFKGAEAVVHLGGIPIDTGDWTSLLAHNVQGTLDVLEASVEAGVRRVLLASSICAYGFIFWSERRTPVYFPIDEEHPCRPDDPYGNSKIMAETLCRAFSQRHKLETLCLRLATVWFPDFPEHTRRFVDRIDRPGEQVNHIWAYVDVRDVVQAVETALEASLPELSMAVNIGAADVCSRLPWWQLVRDYYADVSCLRNEGAALTQEQAPLFGIARARRLFNYHPVHTWREYVP